MDQITITVEQREAIERVASNMGLWIGGESSDNISWRANYWGRGMSGVNSCVGIVCAGPAELALFTIALVTAIGSDEAYDIVTKTRQDSMGYSTIFYFPGVTLEGGDED